MTPAEAKTLTVGDEVYAGAHRGVVIAVTRDEVTVRWDSMELPNNSPWNKNICKGQWNQRLAKDCHLANLTSPIKAPKLRPQPAREDAEQWTYDYGDKGVQLRKL